jgi:anti-anti-sigma regulatory factor
VHPSFLSQPHTYEIDNAMQETIKRPADELVVGQEHQTAAVDFSLAPTLDMRAARELKRSLEQLYSLGRPCVVDAQEVTRISTGCIQILITFFQAMSEAKLSLTLRQPSRALLECVRQLGLSHYFDLCKVEI